MGLPTDAAALLLIGGRSRGEPPAQVERIGAIAREWRPRRASRRNLLRARAAAGRGASPRSARNGRTASGFFYIMDGVVPRTKLAEALATDLPARGTERGLEAGNVFHGRRQPAPTCCSTRSPSASSRTRSRCRLRDPAHVHPASAARSPVSTAWASKAPMMTECSARTISRSWSVRVGSLGASTLARSSPAAPAAASARASRRPGASCAARRHDVRRRSARTSTWRAQPAMDLTKTDFASAASSRANSGWPGTPGPPPADARDAPPRARRSCPGAAASRSARGCRPIATTARWRSARSTRSSRTGGRLHDHRAVRDHDRRAAPHRSPPRVRSSPLEAADLDARRSAAVLAANASGARRLRSGAPRDHILGARS